jgi:hypothetical protein
MATTLPAIASSWRPFSACSAGAGLFFEGRSPERHDYAFLAFALTAVISGLELEGQPRMRPASARTRFGKPRCSWLYWL